MAYPADAPQGYATPDESRDEHARSQPSPDADRPAARAIPSVDTLTEWMLDGECEVLDGCLVEPDGRCPHGSQSWLLHLRLI